MSAIESSPAGSGIFSRLGVHNVFPLLLSFLTPRETVCFDTAMSEREGRDHLVKGYRGMESVGFDEHLYVESSSLKSKALAWVRNRGIELSTLKLVHNGESHRDRVLGALVTSRDEDLATYYVQKSDAQDIEILDVHGYSTRTLFEASFNGYLVVVETLLDRGANPNCATARGTTPLHFASCSGHIEVVRALLAAGADMRIAKNNGQTPRDVATKNGFGKVAAELYKAERRTVGE